MNAIYCRVSTDDQAQHGYSILDQLHSCRQRLLSLNCTDIKEYIDDGYSGEFLERPALEQLRNDLRKGFIQNVMVYDPDRLSRNLTNQLILAEEIEKFGAKILFITGDYDASPEGRLFFSMRGAISAFEKAKIRERSMRGKRAKLLSGKPIFSHPPFGYTCDRKNQQYTIIPEEAEVVREIFRRYIDNHYSFRALACDLKTDGIVNRKGNPFSASVLHSMIANEMYAGTKWAFKTYQKTVAQRKRKVFQRDQSEWISIAIPAIIDQNTFAKASTVRMQNKVLAKRNAKHEYLLSGLIRCAACGYAMRGVTYPQRNKKEYRYYVCTAYANGHACNNRRNIPVQELDDAVWLEVASWFANENIRVSKKPATNQLSVYREQLKKLQIRQNAILKWVSDGTIAIVAAEKQLHSIKNEIDKVMESLSKGSQSTIVNQHESVLIKNFSEKRQILQRIKPTIFAQKENGLTTYSIRE